MKTSPTTAAPALGEFVARYQALFQAGRDHILSIHTTGSLTSIVNFARKAAEGFTGRITVLDSGQLSLGVGYQVLAAAEAIQNSQALEQVLEAVRSTRARLRLAAALDTMEYLRRSGRIPATVAALGGLLSIKPIVEVSEGQVKAVAAARTTRSATDRLLGLLTEMGALQKLTILHTNAEARARGFIDLLMQTCRQNLPPEIRIVNVTTLIGVHVGPNGLGFAAVKREP